MYLALYRKYRPSTFDDVISQEHITTTLKNQISSGQIAHAYLFTGTRGTGKTSCAKIMAKAVNCLSPVNGNPCGECKACKAIAEGSTDIIEIDAASNNGVDSIRQIRDEVIYTPIDCKYKVYIIDEVHMLSDSAFNALLKTLEEPPDHALFILATTEYYKVPATILSRCQQFLFSKIDPVEAKKRLLEVAEKENIRLTENAAALIARLSDGAMRDAWSLLDQCVSMGGEVDENAVRACSGVADSGYLFAVSEAAIEHKPAEALKLLDRLITAGKDVARFTEELTLHYRNIMLTKSAVTDFVKGTDEELKRYKEQCERLSPDEIMRQVDLLSDSLDNINRMKQTGQGRLLAEQLLIRLCSPALSNDAASLAARLGALENRLNNLSLNISAVPASANTSTVSVKTELADTRTASPPQNQLDSVPDQNAETNIKSPAENLKTEQSDFPFDLDDDNVSEAKSAVQAPAAASENIPPFGADMHEYNVSAFGYPSEYPPEPPSEYGYEYPPEPVFGQASEPVFEAAPSSGFGAAYEEASEPPSIVHQKKDKHKTEDKAESAEIKAHAIPPQTETEADALSTAAKADSALDTETKSEELPIPESDIELPENAQPLAQWADITAMLPASSKNILKKARAFLYGGKIYVEAPPSAFSMMKNGKRAVKLRDAVKTVMGGRLDIFTLPEKTQGEEEKEDLVTPFLDRAREMGIEVHVKER